MATITTYPMTREELEDTIDFAKTAILSALVRDERIERATADDWCARHKVVLVNKSVFRTISDIWKKEKNEDNALFYQVVRRV